MKKLTRLIETGLRRLEDERLVRASPYFDAGWYARTYLGGANPGSAASHFVREGTVMGHDPGPDFSTAAYLAANPDVREAGLNALVHYLRFGRAEGRDFHDLEAGHQAPLGQASADRLAEAFDPEFYRATNPDLSDGQATLEHYLSSGWWQRRDPCRWFSSEAYLAEHPDVADRGQNPFVHYLLTGCREGRTIRPSLRTVPEPGKAGQRRPRLAVLAMVRNEADVIRAFMAHLLALFDDVVIVDHMSDDGTAEFLETLAKGNDRIELLRLEVPAYIQSVTMTHLVRETPVLRRADWVFLLDADEFLPFPHRHAFDSALAAYAQCPVVEMRWQNMVPENYSVGEACLTAETPFLAPPEMSPFRKIAFQPSRLSLERIVIAQGNHGLLETLNGNAVPAFEAEFPLMHVPVRSAEQLILKLNQGVEAYRQMGLSRDAAHGTHWDQMIRATADCELTPELLNAVVARYSEDKPELHPKSVESLLADGYRRVPFCAAFSELDKIEAPRRSLGEMLMRIHGRAVPTRETPDCTATVRLVRDGPVLKRADGDIGTEYASLAPSDGQEQPPGIAEVLFSIFGPSYRDIEDLLPSAKTGHLPFLFSMSELLEPRRFVEIGTLRGAGFLSLCQGARQSGTATEAVAISSWAVGPELETEYRNVFETFSFLARKYSDFVGILRQRHEDAAYRFADGSIDLLLLDGFREERSLELTLELWCPKLSDRGVLMLHDINVHRDGFGVWRVWDDLSSRLPSLSFPHAEGLGVACVGEKAPAALVALCQAMTTDRHLRRLVHHHFERLGQLSAELFSRRYDMAQMDARARSEGAMAEELSWLRQEGESLRSENAQLREMLKGGIAHAIAS